MIRNTCKYGRSMVLAGFLMIMPATGIAGSEIAVTGSAKAKVPPDYATMDVNMQHLADRAVEATDRVASIHKNVMDSLQKLGFGESDVVTTNYRVAPHWERIRDKKPKFLGYLANHQLTVQIADMKMIGKVVDAVIEAGATSVSDVKFVTEYAESLQNDVLAAAVRQAHRRAKTIALSAGGSLGEMIEISTKGAANVLRREIGQEMYAEEITTAFDKTRVIPRRITVSITVVGRWHFVTPE